MCWCRNAGTTRLSNTVYNRNAGVFRKHLVLQYAAVYILLEVLGIKTKL